MKNRLLYITCLIWLSACSDSQTIDVKLDAYASDIEHLLGESLNVHFDPQHLIDFPARSALRMTLPTIEINLRDFYGINSCPLAGLVAHRNTAMGKVQLPSQRYVYENALLTTFDTCIEQIEIHKPELASQLAGWKKTKQDGFPLVWANLIQQSQEVYSAFTRANGLLDTHLSDDIAQALEDLKFVTQLKSPTNTTINTSEEIELALQRIAKDRLPATLWRTQELVTQELNELNLLLDAKLETFDCVSSINGQNNSAQLNKHYQKQYIEDIASQLLTIDRTHDALLPLFAIWQESLLDPKFIAAIQYRMDKTHKGYFNAIQAHKMVMNRFIVRCN